MPRLLSPALPFRAVAGEGIKGARVPDFRRGRPLLGSRPPEARTRPPAVLRATRTGTDIAAEYPPHRRTRSRRKSAMTGTGYRRTRVRGDGPFQDGWQPAPGRLQAVGHGPRRARVFSLPASSIRRSPRSRRRTEIHTGRLPERPFLDIRARVGEGLPHGGCARRRQTSYNPGGRISCRSRGNTASAVFGSSGLVPGERPGSPVMSTFSSRWMARPLRGFPVGSWLSSGFSWAAV